MKKIFLMLICASFVTLVMAQGAAMPVAAPAGGQKAVKTDSPTKTPLEMQEIGGTISVTKDANGKVTAIKLAVNSYDIQLNDEGKKLETMDGQKVSVNCALFFNSKGDKILTIKSVEPVTEIATPFGTTNIPPIVQSTPSETLQPTKINTPVINPTATPTPQTTTNMPKLTQPSKQKPKTKQTQTPTKKHKVIGSSF